MTIPSWKNVLPVPPPGARLHEAWLTSFEQPDAGLLVEHLLPSLLGMGHSLSLDPKERTQFFGELGMELESLHGWLTIISTVPRVAREVSSYPWLWRYVSHFTVGADAHAVQHAKLWAFHWKASSKDYLELHVSSTNLTTSAFKGQLQAGWRVMLELGKQATRNARRSWGELVPFLEALGVSAGKVAIERLQRLVWLLSRVECPADVTFVASIPGRKSAARQLAQFEPFEVHVLTPTIGEWNGSTLKAWSTDVGVAQNKVHLKWISESHPWATTTSGWALSRAVAKNLESSGVQIECLPKEARFTEPHRDADPRWSHAKLYLLRSRRKRRLLVTSANWSASAWGAGRTPPRNFELGVIFESEWTDLEALGEPFDPSDTVLFCIDRAIEEEHASTLGWVQASWDGKRIALCARSTDGVASINACVRFNGGAQKNIVLVKGEASMPWDDTEHTPLTARFVQGAEMLEVNVLDVRSPADFAKTLLPEVDPAIEKALREAFLLQRYGGPVVDSESIPGLGGERSTAGAAAPAADYAVQAWIDGRVAFSVVDKWQAALDQARAEPLLLERVRLDGEELRAIYARREGPAASLVAEELRWRIDKQA